MHAWARYTRDRTRTRPHAAAGARPRAKAQLDGAGVAGEGRTRLLSDAVESEERSGVVLGGEHADVHCGEDFAGGGASAAALMLLLGVGVSG